MVRGQVASKRMQGEVDKLRMIRGSAPIPFPTTICVPGHESYFSQELMIPLCRKEFPKPMRTQTSLGAAAPERCRYHHQRGFSSREAGQFHIEYRRGLLLGMTKGTS